MINIMRFIIYRYVIFKESTSSNKKIHWEISFEWFGSGVCKCCYRFFCLA